MRQAAGGTRARHRIPTITAPLTLIQSVNRIIRYTFNAVTALSLLLCVATAALWVRSYYAVDLVTMLSPKFDHQPTTRWSYTFASQPGRMSFGWNVWRAQWSSEPFTHVVYVPATTAPGSNFYLASTAN